MANALVDIIKAGDRDALNAYLLNQGIGGDSSGMSLNGQPNNALTALVRGRSLQPQPQVQQPSDGMQPLNTIRSSSGEYITPSGERSIAPIGFAAQQQAPQFRGTPVDVMGQGKGYMQPDGSIVGVNAAGQRFSVNPAGTAAGIQAQQDAALNRQMKQAQIADTIAQIQQRQMAGTGQKPVFNPDAGGFVYAPSAENPQGKFVPVAGLPMGGGAVKASEDERKAAGWLSQANNAYQNMVNVMTANPSGMTPGIGESLLPESLKGAVRSAPRQQFVQATSSLSEALLRAATGAGVNKDEAAQKIKELTPEYFDKPETVKQKLSAIPVYLETLKTRAGRAAPAGYEVPSATVAPHPQDSEAVQWAKSNPNDPRAARILQLAGGQ